MLLYHFDCRDGGISAASAPKGSSPVSNNPPQTTAAATTATSGNREVEAFDEFDPRGHPVSGVASSLFLCFELHRVGDNLFVIPECFTSCTLLLSMQCSCGNYHVVGVFKTKPI